jgi:hypothetical protein
MNRARTHSDRNAGAPAATQGGSTMNKTLTRSAGAVGAGLLTLTLVTAGATAAEAKGRDVRSSGSCSGATDWKLKAKADDGRLEVEFEVDSNRVGQTWAVRLTDNGTQFFSGNRVTKAPSGSFEVETKPANRAGKDTIRATASNPKTGETCSGSVVF